jgi:hypothetical protein
MNFVQYITAILLSLEPAYADKETWTERTARMEIIAEAIDDASSKATCEAKYNTKDCQKLWSKDKKSLALLLVTKGYWESLFSKNVHEGKCRDYECDPYKVGNKVHHRAKSPWQIQHTGLVTVDEYSKMGFATLESTKLSAEVASRYLAMGMKQCDTISGTIAIYGGAKDCSWSGSKQRAAFYERLRARTEDSFVKQGSERKAKLEERLEREVKEKAVKEASKDKK